MPVPIHIYYTGPYIKVHLLPYHQTSALVANLNKNISVKLTRGGRDVYDHYGGGRDVHYGGSEDVYNHYGRGRDVYYGGGRNIYENNFADDKED